MGEELAVVAQCLSCGTRYRKARKVCPACGAALWAQTGPGAAAAAVPGVRGPSGGTKRLGPPPGKSGKRLCDNCFRAIEESDLTEQQGKRYCPTCLEQMSRKTNK